MIRIAWRSLTAHKLRTILTSLAILLGVAMISGTYVLTDQIDRGFKQIFDDAYKTTDVTVTRKASFTGDMMAATAGLPEALVKKVAAVDGVAEAQGYVSAQGAVAVRGKVVETGGAPTLFFGGAPSDMSAAVFVSGAPATRPGDVAIVQKLAKDQKLKVGSPITVIADSGPKQARVSGVFTFGAESSMGGSLLIDTTLADAQDWFGMRGKVNEIDAKAAPGTSAEALAARIRAVVPPQAEVKTGKQAAADQTKIMSDAIGTFLKPALLSFGGIAILVGAFIIFNAFSMTVAQRRREFAMLRALGASRRQVLVSITGEALLIGLLASVAGLFAGLGVAAGVNSLFKAMKVDIPHSGLVMEPRTVVAALAVGIIVTMLSAVIPAARATRVPPMAALQEGAVLPPGRLARYTPVFAGIAVVLGGALILAGMYGPGAVSARLGTIALGAVVIFFAVAMLSKYIIRPVTAVVGRTVLVSLLDWLGISFAVALAAGIVAALIALVIHLVPALRLPLGALLIVAGLSAGAFIIVSLVVLVVRLVRAELRRVVQTNARLARDNSGRNPGRTAATASALMIGLGVVVFVAVFAQGLKSSFIDSFDKVVRAQYVVAGTNYLPVPTDTLQRVENVPGIEAASGIDMQMVHVKGKQAAVAGIDPATFRRVWAFDWVNGGGDALLEQLGPGKALVEQETASGLGLKIGDTAKVLTVDGSTAPLKIIGMFRDPMMLNSVVVDKPTYDTIFPKAQLFMVFARASGGKATDATTKALHAALADSPTADAQTAQEYKDSLVKQVNQMLNMLYGLLAMSVIISIFGIVNTLVLAVYERTREIGLTRAIGMSRRQVRATVRYESVITSVIGALLGIVVGIVFAWVVTTKFAGQGITFAIPGVQLVVFVIVGVVVGVIAAILPAWRAARIDILEAIHYE